MFKTLNSTEDVQIESKLESHYSIQPVAFLSNFLILYQNAIKYNDKGF
jgi:hypothetical protein